MSKLERRPNVARFSDDGVYRWWLTREFGGDRPLACCGLNPSTATADINDQTIRKDIGFARLWRCGLVIKVNAYGFRATQPAVMNRARAAGADIVGPDNDRWIVQAIDMVSIVGGIFMVAWGNHIEPHRQRDIARMLHDRSVVPMCLGTNGNGTPKHELYQPYERELVPWVCP